MAEDQQKKLIKFSQTPRKRVGEKISIRDE